MVPKVKEIINDHDSIPGLYNDEGVRYDIYMSLSILLTELVRKLSVGDTSWDDPIKQVFFSESTAKFDGLSEGAIPHAISRWLRLYSFDLGAYYPVIKVEEAEESFLIDILIGNRDRKMDEHVDFESFTKSIKDTSALFDFFKDIDLLSQFMPEVGVYINDRGVYSMRYSMSEMPRFLFEIQSVMRLLGIKIMLPKSLSTLIRPRKSMRISSSQSSNSSGIVGLSNLLSFDWRVSLGDQLVSVADFRKLIRRADTLIKYKSGYIYISEGDYLRLQTELIEAENISNVELLTIVLSEEYEGSIIELSDEVKSMIQALTNYDTVDPPEGLQAKFRPYQHRGYSWLIKNLKIGIGSILADDMGLGKTLQVIATLTYLYENDKIDITQKVIIVVPTSLIPNWEAEFKKFAPHVELLTYYGANRKVSDIKQASIILTSYGTVRSEAAKLKKYDWAVCVIDESQNIKNPTAKQTKAVKGLAAIHNIAMSGTPVENRLLDYWSVMDYVNKGLLGNKTSFTKKYDRPISRDHNLEVLERFKKITAPFIMRRMKTDKSIISDLPDKVIKDTFAMLTPVQSSLYKKVVDEALKLIADEEQKEDTSLFKKQGLVLQMILSLKQICNHPGQWLKDGNQSVEDSGKLQLLVDTLEGIIESGDKALIFTQFTSMGDIMSDVLLQKLGVKVLWLHGGVSMKKRKEMVENFQTKDHHKIMILSLKAGGTGLNLTAANHVIHYDLWWNPAVEAQATDRAFRIGQKKNVIVHRFITQHTFEEKINELINSKKQLANMTVTNGEKWIGEMSTKELEELFVME